MTKTKFIDRRNFLVQSTSLLSAPLLAFSGFGNHAAAKYKMGIQLFTVRGPLAKDLVGSIKQISAIGYEDSETYGYDPSKGDVLWIKSFCF